MSLEDLFIFRKGDILFRQTHKQTEKERGKGNVRELTYFNSPYKLFFQLRYINIYNLYIMNLSFLLFIHIILEGVRYSLH